MKMNLLVIISCIFLFSSALVTAEENIASPASWSYPEVIDSARAINPKNIEGLPFDQFGLAYTFSDLAKLKFSSMSADQLQKYADIVTHAYPDAIAMQLPDACDELPVEQMNETAIAGLAYVSINAVKKETRTKVKKCFEIVQKKLTLIGK